MNAIIALEDGTIFKGKSFGAEGQRCDEVGKMLSGLYKKLNT